MVLRRVTLPGGTGGPGPAAPSWRPTVAVGTAVTPLLRVLAGLVAGAAHAVALRLTPAPVATAVSITPLLSVVSTVAPGVAFTSLVDVRSAVAPGVAHGGTLRLTPPLALGTMHTGLLSLVSAVTPGVAHSTAAGLTPTPVAPGVAHGVTVRLEPLVGVATAVSPLTLGGARPPLAVGAALTGLLDARAPLAIGARLTPLAAGGATPPVALGVFHDEQIAGGPRSPVTAGVAHATPIDLRAPMAAGLAHKGAPVRITPAPQAVALALTQLVGGRATPEQAFGVEHGSILRMTPPGPPVADGLEIVQITFDLVGDYGAATATNTTVTGTAWTNAIRAQGQRDGSLAGHSGQALSAQDAYLDLAFPAVTGKGSLTLTKTEVHFYVRQNNTTLNNGSLRLTTGTSANPAEVEHLRATGNIDNLTDPFIVDVTARFPTIASLSGLRARVRHTTALGATAIADVDAVELVITATRTDLT